MPASAPPLVCCLSLHLEGDTLRVTFVDPHGVITPGQRPAADLDEVHTRCARVAPAEWARAQREGDSRPAGVRQQEWRGAERAAALALAELLGAGPLAELGRRAGAQPAGPRAFFLDCPDPACASLPWELLTDLEPTLPFGGWVVLRRAGAPAAPPPAPAAGLHVVLWNLDRADPTSTALEEALVQALLVHPNVLVHRWSPGEPVSRGPHLLPVLHVLAHGQVRPGSEEVGLAVGGGLGLGPAELAAAAQGEPLALLEVCSGAADRGDPGVVPATRLVRHGLPLSISTSTRVPALAGLEFAKGFYGSLATGGTLHAAWTEGLAAQGRVVPQDPALWPWCRPWLRRAYAPSAQVWGRPAPISPDRPYLVRARSRVELGVLEHTWELARAADHVGLEHLCRALLAAGAHPEAFDEAERWLARLRGRLASARGDEAWLAVVRAPPVPVRPITPALLEALRPLPDEASLAELLAAAFGHPCVAWLLTPAERADLPVFAALARPGDEATALTSRSAGVGAEILAQGALGGAAVPGALHLRLLSGPSAGERVLVRPDELLGRHRQDEPPTVGLYPRPAAGSSLVSRGHLLNLGGGEVLHKGGSTPSRRDRTGVWQVLPGRAVVSAGEVLRVGPLWLLVERVEAGG